jgi:hypothetical protein
MSREQSIESAAFQHELDDDARAEHECYLAALEADADYADMMERRRQQDLEAQMEAEALCREPVACRSAGEVMARVEGGNVMAVSAVLDTIFGGAA